MQGLVLLRSNLTYLCNLTSSLQFVLYLQGLNPPLQLGFGLWYLALRVLPHLHDL